MRINVLSNNTIFYFKIYTTCFVMRSTIMMKQGRMSSVSLSNISTCSGAACVFSGLRGTENSSTGEDGDSSECPWPSTFDESLASSEWRLFTPDWKILLSKWIGIMMSREDRIYKTERKVRIKCGFKVLNTSTLTTSLVRRDMYGMTKTLHVHQLHKLSALQTNEDHNGVCGFIYACQKTIAFLVYQCDCVSLVIKCN